MRQSLFRTAALGILVLALLLTAVSALASPDWLDLPQELLDKLSQAGETIIDPVCPVPEHVKKLLAVARGELGYREQRGNVTKYGQWAGNPSAEWCAEYLCWCVDQVDQQTGSHILTVYYPLYGSKNIGMRWFLKEGRYIARRGTVPGWGSQWYIGSDQQIEKNGYIPQPGDWAFFAQSSAGDTTHVAMVEFCTCDRENNVRVYALEGNKPDRVQETVYRLTEETILGYGTVYDLADLVIKGGCEGKKVTQLQQMLHDVGLLKADYITGSYGTHTADAIRGFQKSQGIEQTGVAGQQTQLALIKYTEQYRAEHPEYWEVHEDGE